MLMIDKAICDTNEVICNNITKFDANDRGLLSQNILGHLRNFLEYIAVKVYYNGNDVNPNDYNVNVAALKYLKSRGDLRFLVRFHEMLQKSVSHYTVDKDGSERLMLKYYEHLLRIKLYLKQTYDLDVLQNIKDFPINEDTELQDYYVKIAERIESPSGKGYHLAYNDRYYVKKTKPFFVNQQIYYEVTFNAANTNASKYDRVIAFTKLDIVDNYAVKFSIHNDVVSILDKEIPILIINGYEVSIRPCELDNLSVIFGPKAKHSTSSKEYKSLMHFLSLVKMPLTELVSSDQDYYDNIKHQVTAHAKSTKIYDMLDVCREIIIRNMPGANVLRYLLYKMNNRIIKGQYSSEPCDDLSSLHLDYRCIPFDSMPFCTSLRQHNPRIYDLFEAIPIHGHEHEILARFIKNKTEIDGHLFVSKAEIDGFERVNDLIKNYNTSLYYKHTHRSLKEFKNHIYISGYAEDSKVILKKLQKLASEGVSQYTASVDSWLNRESYEIDDQGKREALREMFAKSRVAIIYGSAGTGKTTLIKHISSFWAEKNKLFLANTHPAVDNLRRKATTGNSVFSTIAKALSKRYTNTDCDILFIDECSTVSNSDMRHILEKINFKLLVLVGDVYQIESIYFGNWFSIAQKFIPSTAIFELTHPFRTTNNELLAVWDRVRKLDDSILEALVKNGYVARFDESIFEYGDNDEVILCLNYDGLYGINSINRFLQSSNPNPPVTWGINAYKVGDPILFNESNIFSPLIYNNAKGWISGIIIEEQKIWFSVELDDAINEIDALEYDFELIGESEKGNSIIQFSVNKYHNTDEDDDDNDSTIIPFQVAYAISIHKAQGLEYNSVKIVITNEIEEQISHNIFYTAITRTRNALKIYWSPETEQAVLARFKPKTSNKDAYLLSKLFSLAMKKEE